LRNVTSKLPERHHTEVKARWWKTFDQASSPAEARRALEAIVADYRQSYPSAMAVIERDLDAVVTHLRWPSEHRKRIRTTDESVKARDSISGMCELFLGACGGGW
jgi:transposase-like protein